MSLVLKAETISQVVSQSVQTVTGKPVMVSYMDIIIHHLLFPETGTDASQRSVLRVVKALRESTGNPQSAVEAAWVILPQLGREADMGAVFLL